MILTCPECSTRFLIDPAVLGRDGRSVKCSKCSHTWVQAPPEDDISVAPPAAAPAVESHIRRNVSRETETAAPARAAAARRAKPQNKRSRAAAVLWTLLAVTVIGVLGAGFVLRDTLVQAWPAAEVIYRAVGLQDDPPGSGLGLRNVSWKAAERDGTRVLNVKGEVANVSKDVREVPKIQGVLFDKDNRELQRWTFSAPESRLLPGENVAFETELKNPADGATRLTIVFAERR